MINGILITNQGDAIIVDAQDLAHNPENPKTLPFTKMKILKSAVHALNFKHESIGVDVVFGMTEPYLYKYEYFDSSYNLTNNEGLYNLLNSFGLAGDSA